ARTRRRGTKGTLSAAPRATAAQRVVRPPMCTTTSRINVGAPTFLSLHTIARSQKRPASERGPCPSFELSTGHPAKDAHPERVARAEGSLSSFSHYSLHSYTSWLQNTK